MARHSSLNLLWDSVIFCKATLIILPCLSSASLVNQNSYNYGSSYAEDNIIEASLTLCLTSAKSRDEKQKLSQSCIIK